MPVDGLEHARLAGETAAVFLRHDHLDDLPPARHQFAERQGFAVGHAPRGRADGLGEVGDRGGVEAIGLGELAGRPGEVAHLTGIDHRERQLRGGEGACDHRLVSACRLERDQDRSQGAQALDKTLKTFVVTRDDEVLPLGRTQTSSRSFDTSISINKSISRPCTCGLATRPRRLFGIVE